jgi:hypothetical protein
MESPIDDRLWKYMFHGIAVTTSAAMLYSMYREKRDNSSKLNGAISSTRKKNLDEALEGLNEISRVLDEEARTKKGVSIITVRKNLSAVVTKLKFIPDSENDLCINALRLVRRVCSEPEGRAAFYKARGYRAVMACLSEAHKNGHVRLMEEAAKALEDITEVDPYDIVLPPDVPLGSEGAAELAGYAATTKMLRTLDPGARVSYLVSVTGALANIATLRKGAKALQEGTDGQPGAFYFLRLITHSNEGVVDKAARALRYITNNGTSQHKLICDPNHARDIAMLLRGSTSVQVSVLHIVNIMSSSPMAAEFFTAFNADDGLQTMFRVWTKSSERQVREMAESLLHKLEHVPATQSTIRTLMDMNRADIHERRSKDEDIKRKQQEQMKQQQMMRQMMMREMMGGGGGEGMEGMMDE